MSYSMVDKIVISPEPLNLENTISSLMPFSPQMSISFYAESSKDNINIKKISRTIYANLENDLYYICKKVRNQWPHILKIALFLRYGFLKPADINIIVALTGSADFVFALENTLQAVKSKIDYYFKKEMKEYASLVPEIDPSLHLNTDLIQVKADDKELERRINTLKCHKRSIVNSSNVLEFIVNNQGCGARVSAPLRKRTNELPGHLLIRRVYNDSGPQQSQFTPHSLIGINQRVTHVEEKLGIPPPPIPSEIYERLQNIENRLMVLEASSPEYFLNYRFQNRTFEQSDRSIQKKRYTIEDIDRKIAELKSQNRKKE